MDYMVGQVNGKIQIKSLKILLIVNMEDHPDYLDVTKTNGFINMEMMMHIL